MPLILHRGAWFFAIRFSLPSPFGGLFYAAVTLLAIMWVPCAGTPTFCCWKDRRLDCGCRIFVERGARWIDGSLLVLLTRYLQERFDWARTLHNEFRHLLGPMCRRDILVVAAASAIGEECLFRGALMLHLWQAIPARPDFSSE